MKFNAKEKAKEVLRERLGPCADPGSVIDELMGAHAEGLCRRYAVRKEFERRMQNEPHSVHRIQEDIAEDFGLSRQGVANIVLGK